MFLDSLLVCLFVCFFGLLHVWFVLCWLLVVLHVACLFCLFCFFVARPVLFVVAAADVTILLHVIEFVHHNRPIRIVVTI